MARRRGRARSDAAARSLPAMGTSARYAETRPTAPLAPVVAAVWSHEGGPAGAASPARILPDGCADLVLAFAPMGAAPAPLALADAGGAGRQFHPAKTRPRPATKVGAQRPPLAPPAMVRSLTPVLHVDRIEPVLPFWVDRLGFTLAAQVPHEDALGFVILARDGVELMYQTRASVAADVPAALSDGAGHSVGLYLAVDDLEAVARALADVEPVVPRRRTFYGADEIGWREPGGHVVLFAQHAEGEPADGAAADAG